MSAKPPRRVALLPLVFVLIGFTVLCGLGAWQIQRLQWKTHMLSRIAALQTAPPEPLKVVLNRIGDRGAVDFTHVAASCPTLEQTPAIRVYAVTDAGVGDRIVTACPIEAGPYRSILVDRGFLAQDEAARLKPSPAAVDSPIVGVLRKATPPSSLSPKHEAGGEWFSRDIAGMAAELHAEAPAPVFLFLESPKPQGFGPTPAPVPVDIPNNHLGYVVTWFGLAAALIGVYIATLLRRRKA
jgi:surfeit locus 1 family protein